MRDLLLKETSRLTSLSRREVLGLIGAAAATSFVEGVCGSTTTSTQTTSPSCVVRPQQTEGPYFLDEKLNRSDIRSDPSDGSVSQGVPSFLTFRVSRMTGASCSPLSNAVVDLWQCDALGVYSDVRDINGLFDTRGKKFLRGFQTTNAIGIAQFTTIYPGWYPGRTVHIHFKIRADARQARGHEFTSQLYFDDAVTDQVHAQAPYASKGQRRLKNDRDQIFRRGGNHLMLKLTKEARGYVGVFDIGLQMS